MTARPASEGVRGARDRARLQAALDGHARATGELVLAESERGRTTRVPWDEASDAVVKETRRRQGWRGRLAGLLVPSRARRAFDAAFTLHRAGGLAPEPLAFLEDPGSATVILRHVPGERLSSALERALASGDRARVGDLALAAATLAARIHAAGVAHGDLKPQNVVLRPDGALVAIDLDGARPGAVGARARAKDLAALDAYGQRGARTVSRRARLEAFRAYASAAGLDAREARALLRAVVARSLWKRARWRAA